MDFLKAKRSRKHDLKLSTSPENRPQLKPRFQHLSAVTTENLQGPVKAAMVQQRFFFWILLPEYV